MISLGDIKINEFGDTTFNEKREIVKYSSSVSFSQSKISNYFIGERVWAYHLPSDVWYWAQIIAITGQAYRVISPAFFLSQHKKVNKVYPISNAFVCYGVSTGANIEKVRSKTSPTSFAEIPMGYREYSVNAPVLCKKLDS